MAKDAPHREYWRRKNRVLAAYLAQMTWARGCDLVAIERDFFGLQFTLERFKSERMRWIFEDFRPWFPFYRVISYRGGSLDYQKMASVLFSRRDLEDDFPSGTMDTKERLQRLSERGFHGFALSEEDHGPYLKGQSTKFDEDTMINELTRIAVGLSDLARFRVEA